MIVAALTWPEAVVRATLVAGIAVVLSILIWSIFRTGQTAIRKEGSDRKLVEGLRAEVDRLRDRVEESTPH
jgi:hypothetical protein